MLTRLIRCSVFLIVVVCGVLISSLATAAQTTNSTTMVSTNATKTLYVFDLESYVELKPANKVWQYDVINFVTALQGLVNRDEPVLYILYVREQFSSHLENVDQYWLEKLRGPNGFLAEYELVYIPTLEDLIVRFRDKFIAAVLWDPNLPSTSNIALTMCGADGTIPIRHDSSPGTLFSQIVSSGPEILTQEYLTRQFSGSGIIKDINRPSSNTKKGDAYLWAKTQYLDAGLCSPTYLACFPDPHDWDAKRAGVQYPNLQHTLIVNRDFYIGKGAFFFDLDPWMDEAATDGPDNPYNEGVDRSVLFEILASAYANTIEGDRMLRVGGFVPWWIKYSNQENVGGKHPYQDTMREFVSVISAYNGIIDADAVPYASMANASVYQHVPLKQRYFQNPVPRPRPLENKNYLLFVIGDFRSSPLLYQTIPSLWSDSHRGEIPLAWAFSPMVSDRVPHILDYMYETRTPNDYFVSATAGAGLNYPNRFITRKYSKLNNGLWFLEKLSKNLYTQFDLRATIAADLDEEITVTSFTSPLQAFMKSFSPQGVSALKPFDSPLFEQIVPFIRETGNDADKTLSHKKVTSMIRANSLSGQPRFHIYRFNLGNPTTLNTIYRSIREENPEFNYELLDPFSFFYLLRQHQAGGDIKANFYIPVYVDTSSIPREIESGKNAVVSVTLRNDGWDTWNPTGIPLDRRYRLTYSWKLEGGTDVFQKPQAAYIKGPVRPGEQTVVETLLESPVVSDSSLPALFQLTLSFEQEGVRASYLTEEIRVVVK